MSASPPTLDSDFVPQSNPAGTATWSPTPATDEPPVLLPFQPKTTVRVLQVINGEHYSGAERVQDLLAQCLPKLGFATDFVALKPGRFGEVRQAKSRLNVIRMRSRFDYRAVGDLKALIKTFNYRLLHAHTPRAALVTAIAARALDLPWVYHVHSPALRDSGRTWQNRANSLVEQFCVQSASRVVVVSPSLVPYMLKRRVDRSRLVYVPNGVPASESPPPSRPRGETLTLGMLALFRPRKGTEVLIEALAALVSRGHRVRLRAIGGFETPEYEAQIRKLVAQLQLDFHVEFTGFTSDVADEMSRLNMMVLPSLYGEGLPMVVLEAMAAGVPVVASRVEGVTAAVEHRESGLLVEPGSVSQLAAAIEEFLVGTVDHQAMTTAAIRRHAERFSDTAMASGVADVYHQALSSHR